MCIGRVCPTATIKLALYSSIWMKNYKKIPWILFGLIKMQTFIMHRWRHILHKMIVSHWPSTMIGPCGESKIIFHLLQSMVSGSWLGKGDKLNRSCGTWTCLGPKLIMEIYVFGCRNIVSPFYCLCITTMSHQSPTMN